MKLAFCADIHLANHRRFAKPSRGDVAPVNSRAADILRVVRAARDRAVKEGVTDLFVLGDVFDTTTPEPQLVAELQRALHDASGWGMRTHVLCGNHDAASDARGDHAAVALDGYGQITVYDAPTILYPVDSEDDWVAYVVPYQPGRADEYLPEVIASLRRQDNNMFGRRVLCLHLGLRDDATDEWLRKAHDSFDAGMLEKLGFDLVVAGNWHGRREVRPRVWQVGALVPTGFDNPGGSGYGTLLIHDGRHAMALELPGPRFLRCASLAELRRELEAPTPHAAPAYYSVRVPAGEADDARELLDLYGVTERFEINGDRADAEAAARRAADETAAAFAAEGWREAVEAYVANMELATDLDRAEVSRLAVGFLGGAR